MRSLSALALGVSLLLLTGCGDTAAKDNLSGSNGSKTTSTQSGSKLIGSYKGKVETAMNKDDPAAKMAEGMMDMFAMELEITPDNKYTLSMIGIPQTGSVTESGGDITLTPEKIMGMTPEEYLKTMQASNPTAKAPDMNPMKGKIEADGKIVIKDTKQNTTIAFTRVVEKKVGASTVTSEEAKHVGTYGGKVDEAKLKPEEKGMAAMAPTMSLKLNEDNTFVMKMGMTVDGKWKVEGDKITLSADKDKGFKGPDGADPQLKIGADGNLIPIDKAGDAPFTFVKK